MQVFCPALPQRRILEPLRSHSAMGTLAVQRTIAFILIHRRWHPPLPWLFPTMPATPCRASPTRAILRPSITSARTECSTGLLLGVRARSRELERAPIYRIGLARAALAQRLTSLTPAERIL